METSLQRTNGNNIPFTSHKRKKLKCENDQLFILTKLIQKTNYSNVYLPRRKHAVFKKIKQKNLFISFSTQQYKSSQINKENCANNSATWTRIPKLVQAKPTTNEKLLFSANCTNFIEFSPTSFNMRFLSDFNL